MKPSSHAFPALILALLAGASGASAQQPFWDTHGGTVTLNLDGAALQAQGLRGPSGPVSLPIKDEQGSGMHFGAPQGRIEALFRANLRTTGNLDLQRIGGGQAVRLSELCFVPALQNNGNLTGCVSDARTDLVAFEVRAAGDARGSSIVNQAALRVSWTGLELRIAAGWAQAVGLPATAAGARVGTLDIDAPMTPGGTFYTINGDDCGCAVDQGDTAASSARVPVPGRVAARFDTAGDWDAFAVDLTAGARYTFRTENLATDADTVMQLRDADGTTVLAEDDDGGDENLASAISFSAPRDGLFYLFVRDYNAAGAGGTWELVVESQGTPAPGPGPAPNPGSGDDHGDTAAGATRLNPNQSLAGRMDRDGDVDYFAVDLAAGQTYVLRTGDLSSDMDSILALFGANGQQLAENDDNPNGGYESWLDFTAPSAGTYYLAVRHYQPDGRGSYVLYVEGSSPPAPPVPPNPNPNPSGAYSHVVSGSTGPDVIVGDLHDLARYGRENGITAFSVGTTSCNIGNRNLLWHSQTPEHPVIGTNMYRLKDGRLEQVGMSWLKHGFFALSENLCFNDCQPTGGDELGVHCSDPYSAGLNGSQSNLGPRSEVNASTGVFLYPYGSPNNPNATIGLRLQIKDADLDPARNQGALYFVEGHYVAADDSRAGNGNNNASARRVAITGSGNNWNIAFIPGEPTRRQKPAIEVWRDLDPDVVLQGVTVQGDGRFDVAYKVTRNADGTWHYEYALYNMTSDRSARELALPIPAGATLTNVGFHDVDYHSGEPFDGADWTTQRVGGTFSWSTRTFAQDRNANAVRWGSMYNFRFDCDRGPEAGQATIGLFKPGSQPNPSVTVMVPGGGAQSDTVAPTFAGATQATALGADAIDVSWAAGSDDRSAANMISYLVYLSTTPGGQDFAGAPALTVRGQTRAAVTGLAAGTRYYVVVRARDEAGNTEQNRVEREARTDTADVRAPTFAGATSARGMSDTQLEVEWAAASDDVSAPGAIRYRIYLATAAGGQSFALPTVETSPGALRATLGGLAADTTYYAVVRAVDEAGREDQNTREVSARTDAVITGGGITGPAVEVDLHRTSSPVAQRGQTVAFTLTLRNVTAQDQVVTGDLLVEDPSGARFRVGRTNPITVGSNRSAVYNLNLPLGQTTALGNWSLIATFTDQTGGLDLAVERFQVAAGATP